MVNELLEGLTEAQREAVTAPGDRPIAVVAGPGSGKTRVLSHRIAYRCRRGDAEPQHTLALTFSRRAASELLSRLRGVGLAAGARSGGVEAGTFHAVAWAHITRHRAEQGLGPPAILGRTRRLLAPTLESVLGREPWPGELNDVVAAIGRARARCIRLDEIDDALLRDVWREYETRKARARVLDLDDLIESCTRLLASDPAAAQIARWRHRHVLVDEYQDLNPAHRRLLAAWVGGRPDLFVVGDPDQAVYGFNGADPDLFERVADDWPGVRVIELGDNFRSSPEIVAVAETARPGSSRGGTADGTGSGTGARPSRRPPGPPPVVATYGDADAEAAAIARAIARRCVPGRAGGSMAVLARTNARLRIVAGALDRAGVAWRLRDPRPLADRPGVVEILDTVAARSPAADLVEVLREREGDPEAAVVAAALAEFRSLTWSGTAAGFRDWLDATGYTADEGTAGGVDLATFHRAKGLEWRAVWIAGVEDGLVPLAGSTSPAALAEEQRLLYVAVTRASEELVLSGAGPASLSPWLPAISDRCMEVGARTEPADGLIRAAALLASLGQDRAASTRRRALLAWRAGRARAAAIPPTLVLPDRALDALAAHPPATIAELVRIAEDAAGRAAARWPEELLAVLHAA